MGNDRSAPVYRGLGILLPLPLGITATDRLVPSGGDAGASYSQAGPYPDLPAAAAANIGNIALLSAGDMAQLAATVDIQLTRGGLPGLVERGAGFVWARDGLDAFQFGKDQPNALADWEAIAWTDGTTGAIRTVEHVHALGLPSGRVLLVAKATTATQDQVKVWMRNEATGAWSIAATLWHDDVATDPTGYHPCLWCNQETGRVFVAHWYSDHSNGPEMRILGSEDEGDTWREFSPSALSNLPFYVTTLTNRLRVATDGRKTVLFACEHDAAGFSRVWQYSCIGEAGIFDLVSDVGAAIRGRFQDVVSRPDGGFKLAYCSRVTGGIVTMDLAEADDDAALLEELTPWDPSPPASFGSTYCTLGGGSARVTDGECALTLDLDGIYYLAVRASDDNESTFISRSVDGGRTFQALDKLWFGDSANVYPKGYSLVVQEGRVGLVGVHASLTVPTYEASASVLWAGGYTSVTRAFNYSNTVGHETLVQRAWTLTWLPYDYPSALTWTNVTGGGAVLLGLNNGRLDVTTAAATNTYYIDLTDYTWTTGLTQLFELGITAGGSTTSGQVGVDVQWDDGATEGYLWQIRGDVNGLDLHDTVSGTSLGSLAIDLKAGVQVLYGARKINGVMVIAVYVRTMDKGAARQWQQLGAGTLTDSGGSIGPIKRITWCHLINSTSTSFWGHMTYNEDDVADIAEQVTPKDLLPAPVPLTPYPVVGGVKVYALGGQGWPDDVFDVPVTYEHAAANMLPTVIASPRIGWRSTTDAVEQVHVIALGDLLENASLPRDSIMVHLEGCNFSGVHIDGWDASTGTAVVLSTTSTATGATGLPYRRRGNAVVPDNASIPANRPFVHRRTYAGGTISLDGTIRPIAEIVSGQWTGFGDPTVTQPVVHIGGLDGTEPSSGTAVLRSPAITIVLHLAGQRFSHLRIRIPAQTTYEGYFSIGAAFFGYIETFGQPYDHTRAIDHEDGTLTEDLEDGQVAVFQAAPPRRVIELAWPQGVVARDVHTTTHPDYVMGTATAGGLPIATPQALPYDLEGLMRDLAGAGQVVCYLPYIPKGPPDAVTLVGWTRRGMLARISGPPRLETLRGNEGSNEIIRTSIVVREEV